MCDTDGVDYQFPALVIFRCTIKHFLDKFSTLFSISLDYFMLYAEEQVFFNILYKEFNKWAFLEMS